MCLAYLILGLWQSLNRNIRLMSPTLPQRTALRDKPLDQPVVMHQRWEDLLFLHWAWDAAEIQKRLPSGLHVDTFEGRAWVAIVPFAMRGIRPRFCPPVPGISDFLEMNLRTYVHDDQGRPGVWFDSLECDQALAVWTARTLFHLPYQHAKMSLTKSGMIHYCSQRRGDAHTSEFRYRLKARTRMAEPGTLEFFLAERYLLFTQTPTGLRSGRVQHSPYPLAEVELESWDADLFRLNGYATPTRAPDHIIGSPGVAVTVYPLTA
jgi:uncharacterized protein YqjF (DUF2071 family)